MRKILLSTLMFAASAALFAGNLEGVTLADSVKLGEKTLVLNGMGLRKKMGFAKIYIGGLYLEKKSSDAAQIIAADAPKRVVMHFLHGEVAREKLAEAFNEGFKSNAGVQSAALTAQIAQWNAALETMHKGEEMSVSYEPGMGTTLTIRGKDKLTLPGLPFAQAVFSVWFGAVPPSADLKQGMLGG